MRIGVYLVDMLDEAHGYTFIADAYSGSGSKQPGFIDVKIGIIRINDMFFFLHLLMHVTFGTIVLSGFTLKKPMAHKLIEKASGLFENL